MCKFLQDFGAWQKLLVGLLEFMCTDTGDILSEEFQEGLQDMLEYSNEFSQLSNARLPLPPISPEVRPVLAPSPKHERGASVKRQTTECSSIGNIRNICTSKH